MIVRMSLEVSSPKGGGDVTVLLLTEKLFLY